MYSMDEGGTFIFGQFIICIVVLLAIYDTLVAKDGNVDNHAGL